jgi:hypothetical protein
MKPTLLVMAAGMGSRFGGAKQIEPVGPAGETLLDYSVYDALRAGFGRVVFIIRHDFEAVFRERVGRRFEKRAAVDYAFQELDRLPAGFSVPAGRAKPWGTGHAVWCAAGTVREPFAAINADDFYGRDAFVQLAGFFVRSGVAGADAPRPAHFAMAGYRIADTLSEHGTVSRGVCRVDQRGRLAGIEELTAIEAMPGGSGRMRLADGRERILNPGTLVSMNCWGFTADVFPLLDAGLRRFLAANGADLKAEFYLPAAVAATMSDGFGEVDVLPVRASWFGVTYREDKPRVVAALAALIAAGEYPASLWA